MNKNQYFIKSTLILMLGKFTTQFMSLLLLPLYTRYLLVDDFGTVDLIQTYTMLFIPVFTFRIDSALFRFIIEKKSDVNALKTIITNTLLLLCIGISAVLILGIVANNLFTIPYIAVSLLYLCSLMTSTVFLQVLRGFGENLTYSIISIITATVTIVMNLTLILIFNQGAYSILLSAACANLISTIMIIVVNKVFYYISYRHISLQEIKKILSYSLPMIPNALSWWIVNVSDRTMIALFLGIGSSAIYTVSCKFSNILNNIFSVVNMSWQESASIHIDSDDRDEFYTKIINNIYFMFATISLWIIAGLPLVYEIVIGESYRASYNYIPILLYGNLWNVLAGLGGSVYIALKKTKEIANTTIISAAVNLLINYLIINRYGLYAACISTVISYFILSIYRLWDLRKYILIKMDYCKMVITSLIYLVVSWLYIKTDLIFLVLNILIVVSYSITMNLEVINILRNKVKKHIIYFIRK